MSGNPVSARPSAGGLPARLSSDRSAPRRAFGRYLLRGAYVARSLAAGVLLWWATSRYLGKPLLLPSPLDVWDSFVDLASSGRLARETLISLRRLTVAYAAAAFVGIVAGFAMARWSWLDRGLGPIVNGLKSLSGIAWIPIALYWFGVGELLPIFIIFYAAVFPFVLNAHLAVGSINIGLIHAARSLGASERRILRTIILPATVPYLLAAARIGLGLAWMSIIAAELLGSPDGLGFSIQYARSLQQTPTMLAWIFWVGATGYMIDAAMSVIVTRLAPWAAAGRVGDQAS